MSDEIHPTNSTGNGGYERSDIGAAGVLYFLAGLAVFGVFAYLAAAGVYWYLDKRSAAEQVPVSPLVTNSPADTRHIPDKYEEKAFPDPLLEKDEFTKINELRVREEQTLSTYDYIDQKTGTVRIPIDRAMDLIAQRGLPVRSQAGTAAAPATQSKPAQEKERKKAKK